MINTYTLEGLLDSLEDTKKETLNYFSCSESQLNKSYAPGKWTVKQLLHHLADAETVLYERIRRGIARPGQVIWGFDQDLWADVLDYQNMSLDLHKNTYNSVRDNIIDLTQRYYISHGQNEYVHNETGLRKVYEEFDKVAWHNEHHLKQIRQALDVQ